MLLARAELQPYIRAPLCTGSKMGTNRSVSLSSPPSPHFPWVNSALRLHLHLFCLSPMCCENAEHKWSPRISSLLPQDLTCFCTTSFHFSNLSHTFQSSPMAPVYGKSLHLSSNFHTSGFVIFQSPNYKQLHTVKNSAITKKTFFSAMFVLNHLRAFTSKYKLSLLKL